MQTYVICTCFVSSLFMVVFCDDGAQTSHQNHHFADHQQLTNLSKYQHDLCPPWFRFNITLNFCQCFNSYAIRCFGNRAYLQAGFCATYDEDTRVVSLVRCPYFESYGFTLSNYDYVWYVQLPENISTLNDYMCGPLNRRGRVCSECVDGFGPAVMSVGSHIRCSNCTNAWYGVPLYLFLEFFPITAFYIIILIFQINITSAPMTCYIMYSQLVVIAWVRVFEDFHITQIVLTMSKHSEWFLKIVLTIYDVWNLHFFRYLVPPFCVSSTLKPIHVTFLGYISIFYPLSLILLTWVCVELHGHNFRPLVWLWRPFHRCFVHLRRGWDMKSDTVDVFASFFLLSFTKVMYQLLLLLINLRIKNVTYDHSYNLGHISVVNVDENVLYGSFEHLTFAIPAIFIFCVFNLLPTLLLIFYPLRVFRACLSKCRLDRIALNTFVEKFYGCYRDGLDGGRDMRSFAGFYFVVRIMLFSADGIGDILMFSNNNPWFLRNIIFISAVLLVGLCKPYKKMYMNVVDTLLLAHFGLLCHLISAYNGFQVQANLVLTFEAVVALPFVCFVLFFIVRGCLKVRKSLKWKHLYSRLTLHDNYSTHNSLSTEQQLLEPTIAEINYGTADQH